MKKLLALFLAMTMVFALSACGKSNDDPEKDNSGDVQQTAKEWPKNVTIETGSSGGTAYYIGAAQSQILSREISSVSFTAEATDGNLTTNGPVVQNAPDCLGFYVIAALQEGIEGVYADMPGVKMDKLCLIMVGNATKVQFVTLKEYGISSLADLKGKKIATPPAGSVARAAALKTLYAYGYTDSDFASITAMSYSDMGDALKDAAIDVGIFAGGTPQSTVSDLNSTRDIVMLPIPQETIDKVLAENQAYTTFEVTSDAYSDLTEPVTLISIPMGLGCNLDMDEDLVYEITKTLNSSTEELASAHAEGINWNTENSLTFYNAGAVPFHPGAARYYDEVKNK